jgi:citrate lyase subunit beta / citryl-CoA lyase
MNSRLHPADVLHQGGRRFPALAACEHYAGSEKNLRKALDLQATLGPVFDITGDCEDGAPAGREREHAAMIASLVESAANRFDRLGARIHEVTHAAWREELETLIRMAGQRLAYLVLPKPERVDDALEQITALDAARAWNT